MKNKNNFPRYFAPKASWGDGNVYVVFDNTIQNRVISEKGKTTYNNIYNLEQCINCLREITAQEAEKLLIKKYSRYFVSANEHWCDGTAYILVEENKSYLVNVDGASQEYEISLDECLKLENDKVLKEIDVIEAKKLLTNKPVENVPVPAENKLPRFFTHVVKFDNNVVYVANDESGNYVISKDGTRINSTCNSLTSSLYYVSQGLWKEITKEEAEKLVSVPPKKDTICFNRVELEMLEKILRNYLDLGVNATTAFVVTEKIKTALSKK